MRPEPILLPAALRPVAERDGLEYMPFLPLGIMPYPVACRKLPVFTDPYEIERLPVQMNFHSVCLDLDRTPDREEYERIMTYLASGYGMRLVHLERILVDKTRRPKQGNSNNVRRRKVRRVFVEYFAPYRVLINPNEEEEAR